MPLHPDASRLLKCYLDSVRCPLGLPSIGSEEECERLLVGIVENRSSQAGIELLIARDIRHTAIRDL